MEVRRDERRQQILAAGLQIIGSVGYHAATVKAICAEAGLTERYFYESFANSEALLMAVYAELIGELQGRIVKRIMRVAPDPDAMARAALRLYFQANREPKAARIMLFEVLGVSPAVDALYRKAMDDFARLIRGVMQATTERNDLSEGIDEDLLAAGLVGSVVQIAMRWSLAGYPQSLDAVVNSAYAIFAAVNRQVLGAPVPLTAAGGKT